MGDMQENWGHPKPRQHSAASSSHRLGSSPLVPLSWGIGERGDERHPQTPERGASPLCTPSTHLRRGGFETRSCGHPRAEPNAEHPSNRRLACCASLLLRGNQAQCQDMYIGNCLACLSGNSRQEPKKRHRPLVEKPSKPESYIMASRRRLYWSTARAVLMPPPDAL
jgi:hypothetical protein